MIHRKTATAVLRRMSGLLLAATMATTPAWANEDAPAAVADVAPATVDPAAKAEIERLLEVFQVRRMLTVALDQVTRDERELTPEQTACLASVLNVDVLYEEMRRHYTTLFSDAAIRAEVVRFFTAPAGNKFISQLVDGAASGEKVDPTVLMAEMTPEELQEFSEFATSPAGALFGQFTGKMKQLQQESILRIMPDVVRQCGHLKNQS